MGYIFMDESGDLGFDFTKKKTTKFFVITFLFVENKRTIEKIVRKTHSELRKKYKKKISILHATKEKPLTRKRLLKKLAEKDCYIVTIYLNKKKVYTKLQDEKNVLYNYTTNILLDRIFSKEIFKNYRKFELIASKKETNKFLNENFKNYLNSQMEEKYNVRLSIKIKVPGEEKCLQAVDFISWAIFRKYEYGDRSYYDIIKSKIVEENGLFK